MGSCRVTFLEEGLSARYLIFYEMGKCVSVIKAISETQNPDQVTFGEGEPNSRVLRISRPWLSKYLWLLQLASAILTMSFRGLMDRSYDWQAGPAQLRVGDTHPFHERDALPLDFPRSPLTLRYFVLHITNHYGTTYSSLYHRHLTTTTIATSLPDTMTPRWKSDYPRRPPRFAWLRSCLPLLVIVILFSFLLSSVALLSHFRSPASKQQLGWQAWDVVEMHYASKTGSKENVTEGNEVFTPSIPLDVWVSLSTLFANSRDQAEQSRTHYLHTPPV